MEPEIFYVCEKDYQTLEEDFIQSHPHVHDHTELSIILSGQAHYLINDKPYTLTAGQLIIFSPGMPHSVILPPQCHYRDLHIGMTHFPKELETSSSAFKDGFTLINYQEEKKKIHGLCKELKNETTYGKPNSKLMIHSLVMQLFVLISRLVTCDTNFQTEHDSNMGYPDKRKVVEFITSYINENYMHEISLEMFAKDIYLSQVYISKIFKEETGHSPIHYLIKKRLAVAKQLLETHDLPIKTVSSKVGYEDAYHFSKLFKKYYGYPPSRIKQKLSS